jgi:predicted nucleic acid-binding protein
MRPCVVDASVVAAAFFPEDHSNAARALLAGDRELLAPDLVYAEVGNVIWKRHARREIDEAEAGELLADVLRLPLRTTPSEELVASALSLALRVGRTVYDCLYIALAVRSGSVMVTADRRLANALAGGSIGRHVAWIGGSVRWDPE